MDSFSSDLNKATRWQTIPKCSIFKRCCLARDSEASKQSSQELQTAKSFPFSKGRLPLLDCLCTTMPLFRRDQSFLQKVSGVLWWTALNHRSENQANECLLALGQHEKDALCWDKAHCSKSDFSKTYGAGGVVSMDFGGLKCLCVCKPLSVRQLARAASLCAAGEGLARFHLELQCHPSSEPEPALASRSTGRWGRQWDTLGHRDLMALPAAAGGWQSSGLGGRAGKRFLISVLHRVTSFFLSIAIFYVGEKDNIV